MQSREILINELRDLLLQVERSENDLQAKDVFLNFERNHWFPRYTYSGRVYQQLHELNKKVGALLERPSVSCQMTDANASPVLQKLMTRIGHTARADAIRHLQTEFAGAKQLIICDPYFLVPPSKAMSKEDYVNSIDSVIPNTITNIELFRKKDKRDKVVADKFSERCRLRGIKLICRTTDELHDRVWILDCTRAYVIGTSFNGLGNKCAFILELLDEDCREFIRELGLVRTRTTRSNSA